MLNENIKMIRKEKGLSQEELAAKLNVVRQTVSKWENGLSVPDADLLLGLSQALETPVSILLGETEKPDDLQALAAKLEALNWKLAQRTIARRKALHWFCIAVCVGVAVAFVAFYWSESPYLHWDYSAPETAVVGVGVHALEWLFVRLAPLIFAGAAAGAFLTRRSR